MYRTYTLTLERARRRPAADRSWSSHAAAGGRYTQMITIIIILYLPIYIICLLYMYIRNGPLSIAVVNIVYSIGGIHV